MLACTNPVGVHLIAEFYGCSRIDDAEFIRTEMVNAAIASGATVLGANVHNFGDGCGVTGVVLLAESHISIHTWPEYAYAAIDVFVCGKADPRLAVDYLERSFTAQHVEVDKFTRGMMNAAMEKSGE